MMRIGKSEDNSIGVLTRNSAIVSTSLVTGIPKSLALSTQASFSLATVLSEQT